MKNAVERQTHSFPVESYLEAEKENMLIMDERGGYFGNI
jgi:hypothetical protein